MKQIERVRAAKLEMAQDNNQTSGGGAENKKSTNLIESNLKKTQQDLDKRRNGPQAANRQS